MKRKQPLLPKAVIAKIKKSRKRDQRTLEEIADKLDCSVSHYWAIEQGRARPRLTEIPALCEWTGLSAQKLCPELRGIIPYLDAA